MGCTVVNVDEIEGAEPGGAVRFLRREPGVDAFGISVLELASNGKGCEHDEDGMTFVSVGARRGSYEARASSPR